MAVPVAAAAAASVPIGLQSTLVQTQRQLVADSNDSIVPKLINALNDGSQVVHQIQNQHPQQTPAQANQKPSGLGLYADLTA